MLTKFVKLNSFDREKYKKNDKKYNNNYMF